MGLGKTIQTIALLSYIMEVSRFHLPLLLLVVVLLLFVLLLLFRSSRVFLFVDTSRV